MMKQRKEIMTHIWTELNKTLSRATLAVFILLAKSKGCCINLVSTVALNQIMLRNSFSQTSLIRKKESATNFKHSDIIMSSSLVAYMMHVTTSISYSDYN